MSVELTLGGITFVYPSENQSPGWGEEATAWAEKMSELMNTLSPLGSIPLTSATILGNQTEKEILGFLFDSSLVSSFRAHYFVERTVSIVESGIIDAYYNRDTSSWDYSVDPLGDASIIMTVDSIGQVKYTTSGAEVGIIKFKTISVISA